MGLTIRRSGPEEFLCPFSGMFTIQIEPESRTLRKRAFFTRRCTLRMTLGRSRKPDRQRATRWSISVAKPTSKISDLRRGFQDAFRVRVAQNQALQMIGTRKKVLQQEKDAGNFRFAIPIQPIQNIILLYWEMMAKFQFYCTSNRVV